MINDIVFSVHLVYKIVLKIFYIFPHSNVKLLVAIISNTIFLDHTRVATATGKTGNTGKQLEKNIYLKTTGCNIGLKFWGFRRYKKNFRRCSFYLKCCELLVLYWSFHRKYTEDLSKSTGKQLEFWSYIWVATLLMVISNHNIFLRFYNPYIYIYIFTCFHVWR